MTAAAPGRTGAATTDAGFGLYLHWPFCLSKCPYCDFNSHVREGVDQARWRAALLAELDHFAAETRGRRLTSVFFGGGTPSLMAPATAAAVLERAAAHWPAAPDLEVTLEANPTSVEAARLADFRAAGVGRVSLGVQALDDADLRFLGRGHDAAEAKAAVRLASRLFDRVSFDLIYARPGQTVAAWRAELVEALAMAGGHLSAYQLTVEPGTAFHSRAARGELALPDEETGAALYETTREVLERAGLPAYEISNHARPGEECRHNLTYWRMGEYVGIGPGAHGRLALPGGGVAATRTHRAPEVWLERVEASGHAEHPREPVAGPSLAADLLMMGLRLTEGVSRARFRAVCGGEPEDAVDRTALARLADAGYLETDAAGLRATTEGRLRLNAVLGVLLG
jgi:oxygen-independent coproporphyrinogen-3 oxidase